MKKINIYTEERVKNIYMHVYVYMCKVNKDFQVMTKSHLYNMEVGRLNTI